MKTKTHIGDLVAQKGVIYGFTEITGDLDCSIADKDAAFPNLTTIGGNADFRGWTGSADKLTTIGGNAYFRGWKGSADKLTTIGGNAYFRGWTGSADKLTTIGGDAYFQGWTGSAEQIKANAGEIAKTICRDSQKAAFAALGLVLVDGILAKLVSKRGPVSRVVIIGQTNQSYIVERDGETAHGATLAEARADLLMKLGNRDTTPYKAWTIKTKVSLEDMIVAYRTIAGACGQGCSHFLAGKNYPAKVSVEFIISETIGKYGHETFKAFFTK